MFGSDLRGEVPRRRCYAGLFSGCKKSTSDCSEVCSGEERSLVPLPMAQETAATWESDKSAKLQIEV